MIRSVLSCLGILLCSSLQAQKSVLSGGNWYKMAITQTGIHRIDAAFLEKMGIDAATVPPSQIRIYGNGGSMLPQMNNAGYTNALTENAIWVQGEEDGRFDQSDAIYFYAEGPHIITYDAEKKELQHITNCYSDTSYYFLTFGQESGLRVEEAATVIGKNVPTINQYDDYWYHEKDATNLLKSGREWWGEYLSGLAVFNLDVNMPDVVPSSRINVRTSAIGSAQVPTKFRWQINGQAIGEGSIGTVTPETYDVKALRSEATYAITAPATPPTLFTVGVTYDRNGQNSAQSYLNYMGLQVKRYLRVYDQQQVYYFIPQNADTLHYQFGNAIEGAHLWNISNPLIPSVVVTRNTTGAFDFTASGGKKTGRYISFKPEQGYIPVSWQRIDNQNIAASKTPDLLIVTAPAWEAEAKRLGAFRSENDGLETLVVTTDHIYNEYASGRPDITAIRDFTRQLYQQTPGKLKYLLLFGDATYDYKNIMQNQSPQQRANWVPVYESKESLNPVLTYSSEDYYGFMEATEGAWAESVAGDHTVEIGIGRLPVKSAAEAKVVVDKLILYASRQSAGSWKNLVRFVADDGDGAVHQQHADQLAKLIQPYFLSSRLFMDEFPQTTTTLGQKAPGLNAAIRDNINKGTLILNYTGHGGTTGWAEEQILTLADIQASRGMNNLPLLFTATCDFGRYDDPGIVSGAELMVLSPRGSAIGAISTTRPVYSSTNFTLSKAFYESLIKIGRNGRMGDYFRDTKNKSLVGSLNRNFTLLGDPSMKLGLAQRAVRWAQKPDTLRALQKVTLKGEVYEPVSGLKDPVFNGIARIAVYDKPTEFQTLGNEDPPKTYSEFRSKLFDGNVRVVNGLFTCEFVMPKDIDYRIGVGRVNVYAVESDSTMDAGTQLDVIVGGSGSLSNDKTPPQVTAFLNNESFKDGDTVDPSSLLIMHVSDENGINLSKAGIGHAITLTLNNTLNITLNDYFTANLDDYRSGVITYPLENLPTGKYVIHLKVWDAYTNYTEIAFGFLVGKTRGIKLNALNIFPNPFDKNLSFELSHDRVNEDLELVLNIFLENGKRLGTFNWQYYNSESIIKESLNSSQLGNSIPGNTLLVYQLLIRSLKDNSVDQRSGKLIRSP
ncbi:type IX secretion system sortase PorU [Dyadobacter pollutisoli]|uniref:Type IX secretion system sortase PorU n=1 Tax=Dyadobacter pollutisoli TaxID=2910158 RepID=A0A9E8SL85_9BACT|nr:type IX secretion system sortase PorU [Dyadobacter pollutisoli]WAC11551.1 type IX secretion system sortase PorU [Dyadobacter pollutisoli]